MSKKIAMPSPDWDDKKLSQYVREMSQSVAVDAWCLGKALLIARARIPDGQWLRWVRDNAGVSLATAHRWVRLAETVDSPFMLEHVSLMEAYEAAGISPRQRKTVAKRQSGADDQAEPNDQPDVPVSGRVKVVPTSARDVVALVTELSAALDAVLRQPKKTRWQAIDRKGLAVTISTLADLLGVALSDLIGIPRERRQVG